ncbi:MAG: class I SAM-dependent methyltransferase [Eubacterium sp.]|nr:class I SAM-dependent methyltransferase [Eubacterium sp.]
MALANETYKELSIKEFTKAAEKYETDKGGVYKLCKKDYPDILKEIEKEDFQDLLDAGCGPAPMLFLLTKQFPQKHYVGIDLTEKMIEVARKKQLPNTELFVGDCENLPFESESFDVVICSMSAHHYPEIDHFYESAYRVLRPNGRLILRDMTVKNKLVRGFVRHIEMPLIRKTGHGDVDMLRCEDVKAGMEKAGFRVLTCEAREHMRLHAVARKAI